MRYLVVEKPFDQDAMLPVSITGRDDEEATMQARNRFTTNGRFEGTYLYKLTDDGQIVAFKAFRRLSPYGESWTTPLR